MSRCDPSSIKLSLQQLRDEAHDGAYVARHVAPVRVDGGMVRDNPEVNRTVASMTALGRVGQPDDRLGPRHPCPNLLRQIR